MSIRREKEKTVTTTNSVEKSEEQINNNMSTVVVTPTSASVSAPISTSGVTATMVTIENKEVTSAAKEIVSDFSEEKDDPEMLFHPTKDYSIADNTNRIGGKRLFQPDPLCRALNCEFYMVDVIKLWGNNPLGGAPIPITYTREFPQVKILYDNWDIVPKDEIINFKRDLAHKHGYRYIYQHNMKILTPQELNKQLEDEKKFS